MKLKLSKDFTNIFKDLFEQASKKQSKGVVKLVSKPEFNFIFSQTNELLIKKMEHPKVQELIKIINEEKEKNKNMKMINFYSIQRNCFKYFKKNK